MKGTSKIGLGRRSKILSLGERIQASSRSGVRESKVDWLTILLYLLIVALGWLNLYSTSRSEDPSLLNFHTYHGREAVFIIASVVLGIFVLFLDTKFLEFVSYFFYGATIAALLGVLFVSKVSGASSWFAIGGVKIQPTEFAKLATLMALAKFMSRFNYSIGNPGDFLVTIGLMLVPTALVVLQNDAGSALVFFALILMFYREGMHYMFLVGVMVVLVVGGLSILTAEIPGAKWWIVGSVGSVAGILILVFLAIRKYIATLIVLGISLFLLLIPFVASDVLQPHHTARIRVLVASDEQIKKDPDLERTYYNLRESMVAIGSGGLTGKGFGNGTHTRGDFVPEEHTDYIFCVLGEEHGFVGTATVLVLFLLLLARVIYIAENSKSQYARVYGYGVAAVIFTHVAINVGMTIGLLPTVGIPLPFFSYGGSSVIVFTLMLFVLMNHYSYRSNILT